MNESKAGNEFFKSFEAQMAEYKPWIRKMHGSMFQAGLPDRLMQVNGRFYGVESKWCKYEDYARALKKDTINLAKLGKRHLTKIQAENLLEITDSGGCGLVANFIEFLPKKKSLNIGVVIWRKALNDTIGHILSEHIQKTFIYLKNSSKTEYFSESYSTYFALRETGQERTYPSADFTKHFEKMYPII